MPLAEVRLALCTGNVLTSGLRKEWKQSTGSSVYNYYGLTETSGICIAEPPGFEPSDERSIGFPVGCLVKVVGEDGEELGLGEQGELCIYGEGNFREYFRNQDASSDVLKNGWFHTRDRAIINEDGSVSLCGRMADIIKLPSGERIDLAAIEEVMCLVTGLKDWAVCPAIEMDKESASVFFVTDEVDTLTIIKQIKQQITNKIGVYAMPSIVSQVQSIPRGNHNKVIRHLLTGDASNVH